MPPSSTPCKHESTLIFFNALRVAERGRIGNIWVNWSQVSQLFLMYLLSKLVEHKSYGNVFVQLYISSDSNILEEAHYLDSPYFQYHKYKFTILRYHKTDGEEQKEKESN